MTLKFKKENFGETTVSYHKKTARILNINNLGFTQKSCKTKS